MRHALIVLSCAIFSCSDNHRPVESLGEFDLPIQHDTTALIYTYRDTYENTAQHTYGFYRENGSVRIMQTISVNDIIKSERFYIITGNKREFVEEYSYDEDTYEKLKGNIKTYKDYDEGKPYRTFEVHIAFTNKDNFRKSFQEKFTYLKDTTIHWNGEAYPAIKFKGDFRDNKVIKYLPFYGDPFEYSGEYYYAKGIGYVKSIVIFDSTRVVWELTSVEKVPQRNAVTMAMLRRQNFESD